MALDLSELDNIDLTPKKKGDVAKPVSTGQPLLLKISEVHEDPNQPRREFGADAMAEMIDSVSRRGVKTPVSVRPHPNKPGHYMLNYGARRLRASVAAGLDTIPAFVDETHEDYDQVVENLQREGLTALEIAEFIKKKLDEKVSHTNIAKELGKSKSVLTFYLAILDAPRSIRALYDDGRIASYRTVYDLNKLHADFPDQVDSWADGFDGYVSKNDVAALTKSLKEPVKPVEIDSGSGNTSLVDEPSTGEIGDTTPPTELLPEQSEDDKPSVPKTSDPNKISKPLLLITYDGRSASVVLNTRPHSPGLIYIRYEDDGSIEQVACAQCVMDSLIDGAAG